MNSAEDGSLLDALRRFIERLEWFTTGRDPEGGLEARDLRLVLAEWDETLEPWRTRISEGTLKEKLEGLAPWAAKARAKVRMMFLSALFHTVQAKTKWRAWEKALGAPALMKQALEVMEPAERERWLEAGRDQLGIDFRPEVMFHDAMNNADAYEAEWHRRQADLRRNWTEECGPETERKLGEDDLAALAKWAKEILGEIAAIQREHPELRP